MSLGLVIASSSLFGLELKVYYLAIFFGKIFFLNVQHALVISTTLLTMILFPAVVQAKTYTDAAKCAIIVHNKSVAPANPPKWVTGTGIGKTKALACRAAKKNATSKAPRGTYARHCDCGKKI